MPGKRKAAKSQTKTKTNKRSHVGYSYRNAWRKFLHAHKGEGLTITELSEMYRDQTEVVVGYAAAPEWLDDKQNDEDLSKYQNLDYNVRVALILKWDGITNYKDLSEEELRQREVVKYVVGVIEEDGYYLGITKRDLNHFRSNPMLRETFNLQ